MDSAASMMPRSISRMEASTSRATKGNAAIKRGTMVALVPIEVPMRRRDRGKTTTIRMRNGTERSRLTTTLSTVITGRGRGRMPPSSPTTRH